MRSFLITSFLTQLTSSKYTDDGGNCYTGLGAGVAVTVTRLRFQPRDWNGKRMTGGKFQGAMSQDGPWTDVYTVVGEPPTGVWTDVRLQAPATFRFWRYIGPDGGHANIKEFELYSGGTIQ